jgi:hypothetical protein
VIVIISPILIFCDKNLKKPLNIEFKVDIKILFKKEKKVGRG